MNVTQRMAPKTQTEVLSDQTDLLSSNAKLQFDLKPLMINVTEFRYDPKLISSNNYMQSHQRNEK